MTRRVQAVPRVTAAALVAIGVRSVPTPTVARQAGPTCIVGVTLIEPTTGVRSAHRRIVIRGDRITEVLDEASAGTAAACATVVDGSKSS
jgi:hypothetical protein